MELQNKLHEFEQKGLAVIGISYDSVDILKAYASQKNITFPLLSDVGSQVIKSFGIFNDQIDPDRDSYGIPHPGIFVIDADFKVIDKQFAESPYERSSGEGLLFDKFDKSIQGNMKSFSTSYLEGYVALTDSAGYRAQILGVAVGITLRDGFHIYGDPTPQTYHPLEIVFEPNDNFEIEPLVYPSTTPFKVEGLDEDFYVHSGIIELKSRLRLKRRVAFGLQEVKATISFQACNDKMCMPPEKVEVTLPLEIKQW